MSDQTDNPANFVLERTFAAPIETVWRTWTDPALFARWYKPNDMCETAVLEHDLQPGGVMRYEMRFGEMGSHYERWEFAVITPPVHLQWKQMLTDADDNLVGNPRMPDWPKVMLTTIDLEAHPDGTLQRLTWRPLDASDAEIACFKSAAPHLDKGWVGGFDNLGKLLAELAG
ncbi:MAG: SRPBCC domain-containing protein [Myxococcales bacterium]|nr:SRPBCC domain-containing protein [Myxococcales bacterium]